MIGMIERNPPSPRRTSGLRRTSRPKRLVPADWCLTVWNRPIDRKQRYLELNRPKPEMTKKPIDLKQESEIVE